MKKLLKNELVLSATVLLGLVGAAVHHRMLTTGLDEKGLLIAGHPMTIALWVLCAGFLAAAFGISQFQKVSGTFREHFPPCKIRGCLSMAGGAAVCLYGALAVLQAQPAVGVLGVLAGLCMVFTGLCRLRGKHPSPMFHCTVCIFFIVRLVLSFRDWSADPQLQDYVVQLMACISLMLFAFHRSSSDANMMNPKRTAFFSLCASFFCLAALADRSMALLFIGAGAWSAGAAPTLEPLEAPKNEEL